MEDSHQQEMATTTTTNDDVDIVVIASCNIDLIRSLSAHIFKKKKTPILPFRLEMRVVRDYIIKPPAFFSLIIFNYLTNPLLKSHNTPYELDLIRR